VGDTVTVSFEVDSDNFVDGTNYPTRGYLIDEDSFAVTSGSVHVGMADPYPSWYAPPYFVLRNNDPAADGFFVTSGQVDWPYPGLITEVWGWCGQFEAHVDIGYDEFAIDSLDILDAIGVYDYDGLTRYYFNMVDCGFEVMGIWFQTLTIKLPPLEVPVDVKPGGCPNPINIREAGLTPVAILGSADLDVTTIDPTSIRLNGVAPLRSGLEDVGAPFMPYVGKEDCDMDCVESMADGWTDLTLKFDTPELAATVDGAEHGMCTVMTLTGNFAEEHGGREITGEDVVVVLAPGRLADPGQVTGRDRLQRTVQRSTEGPVDFQRRQ
jgi:hypothetical protein